MPPPESKTIPYNPNYMWDGRTNFFGASLLALKKLGEQKGYVLVGCDDSGTNAFFVQQPLLEGRFVLGDVASLYRPPACFDGLGHPRETKHQMIEV